MSESKMDNWYFLFKSYHQVNHLSTSRFEAQARKAVACEGPTLFSALAVSPTEKIAGKTRAEESVYFLQARKSVMVRTCHRVPKNLLMSHAKQLHFCHLI